MPVDKRSASHDRRLKKAERQLLSGSDPLAAWISQCGQCGLQVDWQRTIYEALVRAIAHQQLHGKAAASILKRLTDGFRGHPFPSPRQVSRADNDRLRACGFSAAKVVAIKGIAAATLSGQIPTREEADNLSDAELIQLLLPLRGVGRWTVEMILIFALGRLDIMPVDDFGVRSGLKVLYGLPELPLKADFTRLTEHWQPYRSVAAWYLWRLADAQAQ